MNLYLHDIFFHLAIQYCTYGRFRSVSCEQDEAIFKSVKKVISTCTNHKDNLIITILLRVAAKNKKRIEFGSKIRDSESTISKLYSNLIAEDVTIPWAYIAGGGFFLEDGDTFFGMLEYLNFTSTWYYPSTKGMVFRTCILPGIS